MNPEAKLNLDFLRAGAEELASRSPGQLVFHVDSNPSHPENNNETTALRKADLDALCVRLDRLGGQVAQNGVKLTELLVAISGVERSVSELNDGLARLPGKAALYSATLLGTAIVIGAFLIMTTALIDLNLG